MSRAAARITDPHTCPIVPPPPAPPHMPPPGPILPPGAPHTKINGLPAARVGDKAVCIAPAMDTVRGGLITVFIDGSPAARELDKTDVGNILPGASPNVKLGEFGGGPLTPFQAQWLYNYLAQQQNIPFEYATDGCYTRADRMCEDIQALGIPCQKQFVHATAASGPLDVPITNYPGGGVTWGYHVAPVVPVAQPGGGSQPMVLDPSLGAGGPTSVNDWVLRQNPNPGATLLPSPTSPDVYYDGYDPVTGTWSPPEMRNPATTASDLDNFRAQRAALPASSGRNIPNGPVHY
jgi:uncharacterized Zn-binding protein involved in type VI secretion